MSTNMSLSMRILVSSFKFTNSNICGRLGAYQHSRFLSTTGVRKAASKASLAYKKVVKYGVFGLGLVSVGGGTYLYEKSKEKNNFAITNASDDIINSYSLVQQPPKHAPARSIKSKYDETGLKLTLYQYQTCPFCCKVRAFLDYYGFSYDVIEVNSVTRTQTKWTDYRKVPFILVEMAEGDQVYQLKDSSVIISALHSLLVNRDMSFHEILQSYPITKYTDETGTIKSEIMNRYFLMYGEVKQDRSKDQIANERKWRAWVDDVFVHTLSPNVYRTPTEAFQAFSWFSEVGEWEKHFATWERLLVVYVGTLAMFLIGKNLKKRHRLKDDVRQSLYDEADNWTRNINRNGDTFMGGSEPDLSDLNAYGILTAIEGCDTFKDLLDNSKINKWYFNMKSKVNEHGGSHILYSRGIVVN